MSNRILTKTMVTQSFVTRFLPALCCLVLVCPFAGGLAAEQPSRLWPAQIAPAGLVTLRTQDFRKSPKDDRPVNLSDESMLAQSVAGLAAQAVNEGRGDELVYIDLWDNISYHHWRRQLLDRTGIEDRGNANVWDLVARYFEQGTVAGYILYSDRPTPGGNRQTMQRDASANVATSLAGIVRGVMVSERQQATAKLLGLPLLVDARGKSAAWCFENYRDRLNRKQLLLQKPSVPNNRAIAIAHRALAIRGESELADRVYQWLAAPALVHGWNSVQDEGESVRQISRWGHLLCASDWAINLPALSVGADDLELARFASSAAGHRKSAEDRATPPKDNAPDHQVASGVERQVSFVLSDGDNLQWVLGDFAWNKKYWASPQLEGVPFGFGLPIAELMEVAPDAYRYFQRTQPKMTSILVAPGYLFVDHLGTKLSAGRRRELLCWYAARIETTLQRSGLKTIILLCDQLEHPRTQEAWEILAAGAPSLSAAFVMQYNPYEAGKGRSWQFDRPNRPPAAFVSAAYAIWSRANRPRAGSPAEVARMIDPSTEKAGPLRGPRQPLWVAVHAWSAFYGATETVDAADADYGAAGSDSGVAVAARCAQCLSSACSVQTPDTLVTNLLASFNSLGQAESQLAQAQSAGDATAESPCTPATVSADAAPLGSPVP